MITGCHELMPSVSPVSVSTIQLQTYSQSVFNVYYIEKEKERYLRSFGILQDVLCVLLMVT